MSSNCRGSIAHPKDHTQPQPTHRRSGMQMSRPAPPPPRTSEAPRQPVCARKRPQRPTPSTAARRPQPPRPKGAGKGGEGQERSGMRTQTDRGEGQAGNACGRSRGGARRRRPKRLEMSQQLPRFDSAPERPHTTAADTSTFGDADVAPRPAPSQNLGGTPPPRAGRPRRKLRRCGDGQAPRA